jgi:hypothetical protein
MAKQKNRDSLVWGIILIVIGGICLLETFHVHVWNTIWRFWPVIFILWGGSKLYYGLKERGQGKPEPPAPARD